MVHRPDLLFFQVDVPDIGDVDPNPDVGSIYEIGINGIGLMLADSPEDPESLPRSVVPSLEPPRLATSDTPLSQAVERYVFETVHDWSAGAGQRWLNREGSTSRAFWDSEGVDPFTRMGELRLLNATEELLASSYAGLRLVVVGDDLYVLTDDDELTRLDGASGTWDSPFSLTVSSSPVTVRGLASDGQYWYAATGDGILRGSTSNPDAAWSAEKAHGVKWAAGRICAAVAAGSSTTPNRFTTLASDGTEEIEDGHLTLDEGHTIVLGGTAAGTFYFGSYAGDQGVIWAWPLGVDSEGAFQVPYVAWEMPQGQIPVAVATAGGDVWVRAWKPEGPSAGEVVIWRGVPGNGLTPFLVAELGKTSREGMFAEIGDLVVFSWESSTGDGGLGAVSLSTGGYARWLTAPAPGAVASIAEFRGLEVFTVAGQGVFVRDPDSFVTEGWVETSTIDGASSLDKILDSIRLEMMPLADDQEVELEVSLDGGGTWLPVGGVSTTGAQRAIFPVSQQVTHFTVRLTLRSDGSDQTTVFSVQAKYHGLGLRDLLTVVRVKAYDNMTGLNGAPLPTNGVGRGAQIMRMLESLGQSRVLFQDVDWHITGDTHVAEVVSVRSFRRSLYDRNQHGMKAIGGEVEVTLRRVDYGLGGPGLEAL